jgi:hypothetical protein
VSVQFGNADRLLDVALLDVLVKRPRRAVEIRQAGVRDALAGGDDRSWRADAFADTDSHDRERENSG